MKTSSVANEFRAEGRIEERQAKLKRILTKRLGDIPIALIAAIDSTDDASVLDDWFDSSLEAASFDDMKARMRV